MIDLESWSEHFKCFVKTLVHGWWAANPNSLDLASILLQMSIDVDGVPRLVSLSIVSLGNSDNKFKVVVAKSTVDFDKCFAQVKTTDISHVWYGHKQNELEL